MAEPRYLAATLAALSIWFGGAARASYTPLWADGGVAAAPALGYYQADLQALPDGQGGLFLVWTEFTQYTSKGWTGGDIRAQRLDANGARLWGEGGVTICGANGDQQTPALTTDGAGGIVVAWVDHRVGQGDIFAQRVSGGGAPLWAAGGVALCSAQNVQQTPVLCPDGAGGAIVAWEDYRASVGLNMNADIYVQRARGDGSVAWTANGVSLGTAQTVEFWPRIAADGGGGAMVAWTDAGTGDHTAEIRALHVADTGAAGPAIGVGSAPNDQILNTVAPDGTGGYLLAWWDYRSSTAQSDVYIQRLDVALGAKWGTGGKALATGPTDEYEPILLPDGQGGASVAYHATGNGVDILAAKISADGTVAWTGQPVSAAASDQVLPAVAPDGRGGLFVTWEDHSQESTKPDIYAQQLSALGNARWDAGGAPVASSLYFEQAPVLAVSDGAGGVIVAWEDWRDIGGGQAFAQRLRSDTMPPSTGDADGDGQVTAADAGLLMKTASGLVAATDNILAAGDVCSEAAPGAGTGSGDGHIGMGDALRVLRAALGLDTLS